MRAVSNDQLSQVTKQISETLDKLEGSNCFELFDMSLIPNLSLRQIHSLKLQIHLLRQEMVMTINL